MLFSEQTLLFRDCINGSNRFCRDWELYFDPRDYEITENDDEMIILLEFSAPVSSNIAFYWWEEKELGINSPINNNGSKGHRRI